jgi:hypothetical protein
MHPLKTFITGYTHKVIYSWRLVVRLLLPLFFCSNGYAVETEKWELHFFTDYKVITHQSAHNKANPNSENNLRPDQEFDMRVQTDETIPLEIPVKDGEFDLSFQTSSINTWASNFIFSRYGQTVMTQNNPSPVISEFDVTGRGIREGNKLTLDLTWFLLPQRTLVNSSTLQFQLEHEFKIDLMPKTSDLLAPDFVVLPDPVSYVRVYAPCKVINNGRHINLPSRSLARIVGGGGGYSSSNICQTVKDRIAENQLVADIYRSAKLRKFHKTYRKSTGLNYPELVQRMFDVFHSEYVMNKSNVMEYIKSLSMQELYKLVVGDKNKKKQQGVPKATVTMETCLNNCRVFANITDKKGRIVKKIYLNVSPRSMFSSVTEIRKAAKQIIKNKAEVLKYYQSREGKKLGKINFDADLAHEMEHVMQCNKGDAFMTLDDISKAEIPAYRKSGESLMTWYLANCSP